MIAYIDGVCDSRITRLDIFSIKFPEEFGITDVEWDEQDIVVEKGIFTARLKGIYFNREYANGKGKLLQGLSAKVEFNFSAQDKTLIVDTDDDFNEFIDEMLQSIKCAEIVFVDIKDKYEIGIL